MSAKYVFNGDKRKVREVLMIDGVKLVLAHQMGKFQSHDTIALQHTLNARDEIIQIGYLSKSIICDHEIRFCAFRNQLAGSLFAKDSTRVGTPLSTATLATFAARSMPSTGIRCCTKYCNNRHCWQVRPRT